MIGHGPLKYMVNLLLLNTACTKDTKTCSDLETNLSISRQMSSRQMTHWHTQTDVNNMEIASWCIKYRHYAEKSTIAELEPMYCKAIKKWKLSSGPRLSIRHHIKK